MTHLNQGGLRFFIVRFDHHLDAAIYGERNYAISIVNSFVLVILLGGIVMIIMVRTLKHDISRYENDHLLDRINDEYGWKLIHADVFRVPERLEILASLYGTGMQLNLTLIIMIILNITFKLHTHRSSMVTASIFVYALSSFFGGLQTTRLLRKYQNSRIRAGVILTALIWPGSVSSIMFLINFLSISYQSTRVIGISSMVL